MEECAGVWEGVGVWYCACVCVCGCQGYLYAHVRKKSVKNISACQVEAIPMTKKHTTNPDATIFSSTYITTRKP